MNLNQAFDNFNEQTLKIITEALNEKDQMIKWWKTKAKTLANKYQACLYCQSNQNFIPELLTCQACQQKEQLFWKDITLKEENHE